MSEDPLVNDALEDAERLAEAGDREAVARRLADVTVRGPKDAWRLGLILELVLERYADAEALYRQALEAVPEAIVDLTLLLDQEGRTAEADGLLRALPGEEEAVWRVKRGRALRADGEIERALAEYVEALSWKT